MSRYHNTQYSADVLDAYRKSGHPFVMFAYPNSGKTPRDGDCCCVFYDLPPQTTLEMFGIANGQKPIGGGDNITDAMHAAAANLKVRKHTA